MSSSGFLRVFCVFKLFVISQILTEVRTFNLPPSFQSVPNAVNLLKSALFLLFRLLTGYSLTLGRASRHRPLSVALNQIPCRSVSQTFQKKLAKQVELKNYCSTPLTSNRSIRTFTRTLSTYHSRVARGLYIVSGFGCVSLIINNLVLSLNKRCPLPACSYGGYSGFSW